MIRRAGSSGVLLLLVAGCVGGVAHPGAHELERTRVSLAFQPDGVHARDCQRSGVATAPAEPFLEDYPEIPARDPSQRLTPATRDERLARLAPVMRDRIVLFVDGREIVPAEVTYEPPAAPTAADGTPTPGLYRLRGRVSPDARMLRWFYGIVADPIH